MRLEERGERGLVEIIKKLWKVKSEWVEEGIGDDCAVLKNGFIFTMDSFVEGTHFYYEVYPPHDLGYMTLAASLSDIAAMAGEPLCFFLSLSLWKDLPEEWVTNLLDGMQELAEKYSCELAGGETVAGDEIAITIGVLGRAEKPVRRKGRRIGDYVYVTGIPGRSYLGRLALYNEIETELVMCHLRPEPRIREARMLVERYTITSMIDVSDGVLIDLSRLEGEGGIYLESSLFPTDPEIERLCDVFLEDPVDVFLRGGEDYELLFTSPDEIGFPWVKKIGVVREGEGIYIDDKPTEVKGYEHFC